MDGDVRVVILYYRWMKMFFVILNMFILFILFSIFVFCVVNFFGIKKIWIVMWMMFMFFLSINVIFVNEYLNLERSCKFIV